MFHASINGAVTVSPFEAAVPWDVLFVDMRMSTVRAVLQEDLYF